MYAIQGVATDAYHVQSTRSFRGWSSTDVDCLGHHSSSEQECQDSSGRLHLNPLSYDKGVLVFPETEDYFHEKLLTHSLFFFYQGHRTVVYLGDLSLTI